MNEIVNVIIENVVQIVTTLVLAGIGIMAALITAKLAKNEELKSIAAATDEATKAAEQTVLELQQTTVEGLKKASADGKLTKDEIAELGKALMEGAMAKMSTSAVNLLNAAGVNPWGSAVLTWLLPPYIFVLFGKKSADGGKKEEAA